MVCRCFTVTAAAPTRESGQPHGHLPPDGLSPSPALSQQRTKAREETREALLFTLYMVLFFLYFSILVTVSFEKTVVAFRY